MSSNSTLLDIINTISSIVSLRGYDGALDENGEYVDIGLKRDEGHKINDSRILDGFSVKFQNEEITICYHSDVKIKQMHEKSFETDVEEMIDKVASFLKKEYKSMKGSALSLTPIKDSFDVLIQSTSSVRSWIQAQKRFTVGGLPKMDSIKGESRDSVDKKFQDFIKLGGWKGKKRPENEDKKVKNLNKREDIQNI